MIPTESIRGRTFDEYLKATWEPEDNGINFMVEMTCLLTETTTDELKALPKQIQVYWFERTRTMMIEALKKK